MQNNTDPAWEPEENSSTNMPAEEQQTENMQTGTAVENGDPMQEDEDIEEGSLEDEEPEQLMDESTDTATDEEQLELDEVSDEDEEISEEDAPRGGL